MPELRLNLITREWVVIDTEKSKKPKDFISQSEVKKKVLFLAQCPFCPGNESRTPDELYRLDDETGWKIRVVPNKFGRLSREGEKIRCTLGLKKRASGIGISEIVIESPIHSHTIATMSLTDTVKVLQTYRDRFVHTYQDPRVEHVIIFKNYGPASGTSITHPHSQIVGIPVIPMEIRDRISSYMRFFDENGDCLVCQTLDDELKDGSRILFTTEHFVSFVPYAALSPFHIWVYPKRHSGSFADIRSEELQDLAKNLKSTMSSLYYGLEDPDLNYIIRSSKPSDADSGYQHWYLSIVPRVWAGSGFELGSGIYVNPLLPELSAEFLRSVTVPE